MQFCQRQTSSYLDQTSGLYLAIVLLHLNTHVAFN